MPASLPTSPPVATVNAFFLAAKTGNLTLVNEMIESDSRLPLSRDHNECTPLMAAAQYGQLEMVKRLLSFDPLAVDREGRTALFIARNALDCLQVLLPVSNLRHQDNKGRTALMKAAYYGHEDAVALLLPYSDAEQTTGQNETALSIAAHEAEYNTLKVLIEANPKLAAMQCQMVDNYGRTPLMLAASSARNRDDVARCLELLLPLSDVHHRDHKGNTALMTAAHFAQPQAVQFLLAPSDVQARNNQGLNALMLAARFGETDSVELLLPLTDEVHICDHGLSTALMLAACNENMPRVSALLVQASDPLAVDHQGQTALILAATRGFHQYVAALAPCGGVDQCDDDGRDALDWILSTIELHEGPSDLRCLEALAPYVADRQRLFDFLQQPFITPELREQLPQTLAIAERWAMEQALPTETSWSISTEDDPSALDIPFSSLTLTLTLTSLAAAKANAQPSGRVAGTHSTHPQEDEAGKPRRGFRL